MASRSDGQVSGQTVEVTVEGVMSVFRKRTRGMLDDHGIEEPDPQPDDWYELSDFVAVLETIKSDAGENALQKIGEATPTFIDWPGDPDSTEEALESLQDVYEQYHRNARGGYSFEQIDDSTAHIEVTTPYPCQFDKGLLIGTAEAYGASYARVTETDDGCRDHGDDACAYEISW